MMRKSLLCTAFLASMLSLSTQAIAEECTSADAVAPPYPTTAIADYVLGCMAANGNSFESLHQCSCSIDFISERIPYEDYEMIQTVMMVQQDRGQRGIFYRDSKWAKSRVEAMQKVQAESTLRCF